MQCERTGCTKEGVHLVNKVNPDLTEWNATLCDECASEARKRIKDELKAEAEKGIAAQQHG